MLKYMYLLINNHPIKIETFIFGVYQMSIYHGDKNVCFALLNHKYLDNLSDFTPDFG